LNNPSTPSKLFTLALLAACLISFSGCIYLVVGGIGAVGGYIVSPDTVEGISDSEIEEVWDVAVETLSIMGLIEEKSEESGIVLATVSGAKITVKIASLSPTSTRVTVKARKSYLPRISISQDVFVKIMSRLKEEM